MPNPTEQVDAVKEATRKWEVFTGRNGKGVRHSWTPRKPNCERRDQILSLSQQGLTARQIGNRLNPSITPSAVSSMLRRLRSSSGHERRNYQP